MEALNQGADHWLPRDLALSCPALLAATLQTAALLGDLRRRHRQAGETLAGCSETGEPVGEFVVGSVAGRRSARMVQPTPHAATFGRGGGASASASAANSPSSSAKCKAAGVKDLTATETQSSGDVDRLARDLCQAPLRCGRTIWAAWLHAATAGRDAINAVGACRRLQSVLEEPPALEETPLPPVQACFGLAAFSPSSATVKALLRQAEERSGRGQRGRGRTGGNLTHLRPGRERRVRANPVARAPGW